MYVADQKIEDIVAVKRQSTQYVLYCWRWHIYFNNTNNTISTLLRFFSNNG